MKRVIPPSVTCSNTMSAWARPVCGRASGVFSTFTHNAGLVRDAPLESGSPSSGAVGCGAAVDGGAMDATVVVAAVVVVDVSGAATGTVVGTDFWPPLLHAAAPTPMATATSDQRRVRRPR